MGMPVIKRGSKKCEDAVGDIIESISMEEKSIAHILNAESEKLTKIISKPNVTSQQLIMANKSVKETIDAIIRMESVLQAKLNLFECLICKQ